MQNDVDKHIAFEVAEAMRKHGIQSNWAILVGPSLSKESAFVLEVDVLVNQDDTVLKMVYAADVSI